MLCATSTYWIRFNGIIFKCTEFVLAMNLSGEFSFEPILDFLTKIVPFRFFFFFFYSWPKFIQKRFPSASITKQTLVSTMNTWGMLRFLVRLNIYQLHSLSRPVSMCVWLGCACATDFISDASRDGTNWHCTAAMESSNTLFRREEKKRVNVCRCIISHDAMMNVAYSSPSQLNENYVRDWSQTTVKWGLESGANVSCIFRSMHSTSTRMIYWLFFIFVVTCNMIYSDGRWMVDWLSMCGSRSSDVHQLVRMALNRCIKLYYCHFPWR